MLPPEGAFCLGAARRQKKNRLQGGFPVGGRVRTARYSACFCVVPKMRSPASPRPGMM
ncbi:Uncharacterised protein [Bordetella pertussis]|nr:Uncharacterised protein [Bordetella pertussis]CFW36924.1 Uncharacterised protein [Bordetella pertussis]